MSMLKELISLMIFAVDDRVPVVAEDAWVAESATVVGTVRLGPEVNVWFGAVIRGDNDWITIGARTNVQDGCVLHADEGVPLAIGAGVTIGHMAMLHGCTIEDGCLIGIGAVVLNGARVGQGSLIGAKALVTEDMVIPPGVLVLGSPGKVVRDLRPSEVRALAEAPAHYVAQARRFRSALRPMRP